MAARAWLLAFHETARLAAMALLAIVTLAVARARYASPSPRGADAPEAEFSAIRAHEALGRVLEGGAPHPVGSEAQAQVRARIVRELERAGYQPREQKDVVCGPHATCAFVTNIVAELSSSISDAVLVAAHYDSVPAAAGANDDGSGIATLLETARALKRGPAPARSVIFLFTDAEEDGLLGARAFVESDPDRARVRAVVNIDARGSRGPAIIFETSDRNGATIALVAKAVPRPVTSWLFLAVYRHIPNDTDFSVLKRGALGANFAIFSRIADYHTPLDRLDHTDAGALQQEGDGALALTRAFARGEAEAEPDVVWFDVLALGVVRWPESWTAALAGIALALVLLAIALRKPRLAALAGLVLVPLAAAIATSLGIALGAVLEAAGAAPAPWTANGPWIVLTMELAGVALGSAAASFFARAGEDALWAGVWTAFALVGAALAIFAPGASYLFVGPSLAAGAASLAGTLLAQRATHREGATRFIAIAAPALVLLVLWSPLFFFLYDAFGMPASPLLALGAAVATTTCAPLFAGLEPAPRAIVPGALVLAALVAATVAASTSKFTPESPSRVNVIHAEEGGVARTLVDDRWGNAEWGAIPTAMRIALGPARVGPRFPWSPDPVLQAAATPAGLTPPEAIKKGNVIHVRSARGARTVTLLLPPDASARFVRLAGRDATAAEVAGWTVLTAVGVPNAGFDVELAAPGAVDLTISDETSGLPPASARVAAARPPDATPVQRGDVTIVSRHVRLE